MNNPLIEIFENAEAHYYFVTNTDFFSISFFNHEYRNHGLPIAGYSHKECRLSLYDNELINNMDSPSVKQELIDYLYNEYNINILNVGSTYKKKYERNY